jgi:hypothetical protein
MSSTTSTTTITAKKQLMRKHITMAITTVCFVVGLYAGDWARKNFIRKKAW